MSCGTDIRDTVESVASVAGNYVLPGSSMVTDRLVSKGAQKQLNSPVGQIAQIGSGLAGAGVGEATTGIKSAAEEGAGWTNAANAVGGFVGDPTLGTDIAGKVSSVTNSIGDAASDAIGGVKDFLGITPSTGATTGSTATGSGLSSDFQIPGTSSTPFSGATPGGGVTPASSAISSADSQIGSQIAPGGIAGESSGGTSLGSVGAGQVLSAGESNLLSNATNSAATTNVSAPGGVTASPAPAPESFLHSLIPSGKTAVAAAIPLGELAYQAIKGAPPLPDSAQALGQSGAVTAPLLATESSRLNEANTGELSPGEKANIAQFVQQQQNQLLQRLAQQGVQNPQHDSRYQQGMAEIQAQALALTQQYVSAALNAGLQAAGAASGNLANVANAEISQDNAFQDAMSKAVASLGGILGGVPNITIGGTAHA